MKGLGGLNLPGELCAVSVSALQCTGSPEATAFEVVALAAIAVALCTTTWSLGRQVALNSEH